MTSVFGNNVYKSNALCTLYVPSKDLAHATVSVPYKRFAEWTADDHRNSFELQKRITSYAGQYLVYGKFDPANSLSWKIVPYKKCYTFIGRIIQRIQVLVGIVFGTSEHIKINEGHLKIFRGDFPLQTAKVCHGTDVFCQKEIIDRQWVLKGKHITVVFNHGEFAVVTNAHRETLTDLTENEYTESMETVTKLIIFLMAKNKSIKNIHLLEETSHLRRHWHLRFIVVANGVQTFWEKYSLFKRFFWGPPRMEQACLSEQVRTLRDELKELNSY